MKHIWSKLDRRAGARGRDDDGRDLLMRRRPIRSVIHGRNEPPRPGGHMDVKKLLDALELPGLPA
ncbi:hypothetical protein HBB16_21685 [Pseudonocardia sp. MCCB 268]|nr:hypothetical protein [Pseudonocardia cytotoxica]